MSSVLLNFPESGTKPSPSQMLLPTRVGEMNGWISNIPSPLSVMKGAKEMWTQDEECRPRPKDHARDGV